MSDQAVIELLLRSNKILVPYQEIQGSKQVASILSVTGERFSAYKFLKDDMCWGVEKIEPGDISSEDIQESLRSSRACYEEIALVEVRIVRRCVLWEGKLQDYIIEVDLIGTNDSVLRLRSEQSMYSDGFMLRTE